MLDTVPKHNCSFIGIKAQNLLPSIHFSFSSELFFALTFIDNQELLQYTSSSISCYKTADYYYNKSDENTSFSVQRVNNSNKMNPPEQPTSEKKWDNGLFYRVSRFSKNVQVSSLF